jgi:isocitrate/isopropylmalate dehydrogenase
VAAEPIRIVVLEGDETGQELLEAALAVLDPDAIGFAVELERFDLSLENRRRTANGVCTGAAVAMRAAGLGLKAATITPEGADDVGSPNRLIREGIDGTVIVRTGRRIPGVAPIAGTHHPITVCRMAVGDAYGAEQWRERSGDDEIAFRTERISRRVCRAVAEHAFRIAAAAEDPRARVYGGPKWTVSPVYEGMLKEEMDAAAGRHPDVPYEPVLIDATYAGLVGGAATGPLVIPTLNRDGDLLSDLVMPMFGSIAGAESILLSLDDDLHPAVAMAEAPHGTAPSLAGKDVANPMAMILACAAVLHYAGERGHPEAERASAAIYEATLGAAGDGIRTHDLGGEASTSEVCAEVATRMRRASGEVDI